MCSPCISFSARSAVQVSARHTGGSVSSESTTLTIAAWNVLIRDLSIHTASALSLRPYCVLGRLQTLGTVGSEARGSPFSRSKHPGVGGDRKISKIHGKSGGDMLHGEKYPRSHSRVLVSFPGGPVTSSPLQMRILRHREGAGMPCYHPGPTASVLAASSMLTAGLQARNGCGKQFTAALFTITKI